jgi:hypothetical protein
VRRRKWAVLTLVPALLSGCGVLGLSSGPGSGGTGTGATAAASASPWIVVATGSATPSPVPTRPAATPATTAGFLRPGTVRPAARPPGVTCEPTTFNFAKIAGARVTPSATSAVVNWYNTGGYNLVEFRVTAISQDLVVGKQRDVGFVTVKPGAGCRTMSATITGLDRRTGYVFSVAAVVLRRSGDGTHAGTVARSHAVRTT